MRLPSAPNEIIYAHADFCSNEDDDGPFQKVRLLVLHDLQEVLELRLTEAQLHAHTLQEVLEKGSVGMTLCLAPQYFMTSETGALMASQ